MRTNRPALCAARWIIPDTDSIEALIDTVLSEQAWWIAVRCGKHAHRGVVWAEGTGRPNPQPVRKGVAPVVVPVVLEDG
jgi:hypothetical protein